MIPGIVASGIAAAGGGGGTYYDEVIADSPIAYWRLGEASGTTAVDETGSHDGTYGGAYTQGAASLLATDADTALSVAGSGYVTVPDDAALDPAGDWTIEAWVKFSTSQSNRAIVAKWGSDLSYVLNIPSSPANTFKINIRIASTTYSVTSPLTYNDGSPHHVIAVRDATTLRLYVDGSEVGSPATIPAGAIDASTSAVRIGNYSQQTTNGFIGVIDEVALYAATLSPTRIAAHYAAGT